jgi:hypothetical protein
MTGNTLACAKVPPGAEEVARAGAASSPHVEAHRAALPRTQGAQSRVFHHEPDDAEQGECSSEQKIKQVGRHTLSRGAWAL